MGLRLIGTAFLALLVTNCGLNQNTTERTEIGSEVQFEKTQLFSADSVETKVEDEASFNFSSTTASGTVVDWTIYRIVNAVLHHDGKKVAEVEYNAGFGGKNGMIATPWYSNGNGNFNEYAVYAFNPARVNNKFYTPMPVSYTHLTLPTILLV